MFQPSRIIFQQRRTPERQHNCHTAKETEIVLDEWHVFWGFGGGRCDCSLMKVFPLPRFQAVRFEAICCVSRHFKEGKFLRRINSEKVISCWVLLDRSIRGRCDSCSPRNLLKGRCSGQPSPLMRIFNPTLTQLTCVVSPSPRLKACHNAPDINHNSIRPPTAKPPRISSHNNSQDKPFHQSRIARKWKTISLSRYCRKHHKKKNHKRGERAERKFVGNPPSIVKIKSLFRKRGRRLM